MEERCPRCGALVSEEDYNEEVQVQHCPECLAELPRDLAERMFSELERKTVVCPSCGKRSWKAEVDVNWEQVLGFACPECGALYPEEVQDSIHFAQMFGAEAKRTERDFSEPRYRVFKL